jgi:hypothetical protein
MPVHPRPVPTSSYSQNAVDYVDDDEDESDEEGGMGIKMVDNDDGDLEYCDPTPLEEPSSWR